MQMITTTPELAALCETLAKGDYVAVDTEFLREQTFWPLLCLVQLAGPDAIRALSSDTGIGDVARHRHGERNTAAEDQDSLKLPAAEHRVGHTAAREERLALAKRKLVSVGRRERMRHVVFGRSGFESEAPAHSRGLDVPQALRERVRRQEPKPR